MDQDDRIFRGGSCFREAGVIAHAGVHYVRGEAAVGSGGRPANGNQAYWERRGGKNFEMGVAFRPAGRNREFFGMDVVNASVAEGLHGPIRGAVGCRRAGDAATDGVAEIAQVFFKGRGTEGRLNHAGCQVGARFLQGAGARALRDLL